MASTRELKKDFKRLADGGRLAQSYLLFGHESGAEKFLFAQELTNYLENKKWELEKRILVDANIINAQEEAGIDLVRAASQFLWQKPAVSERRTLIINQADYLTLPAQNAILKISEEPPPHALIIILVKNYEVLLPALQSRFQKIYLHANSKFQNPKSKINSNYEISKFLKAEAAQKKEMIKEIIGNEAGLTDFVTGLIAELREDRIKNHKTIKELLHRWTLINQFNVNKKLQLETALLN